MSRSCSLCGQPFDAKRSTAKYCSSRCRSNAAQRRKRETAPAVAVTVLEPADGPPALVVAVSEALEAAGKTGWRAQQAAALAGRLATMGEAGAAAVSKELDRVMSELLADAERTTDVLDEIRGNVVPMRQRRGA